MLSPRMRTPCKVRFGLPTPPPSVGKGIVESETAVKVRVVVRIRPFLTVEKERAPGHHPRSCVSGYDQTLIITDPNTSRRETYKLDSCYSEHDNIRSMFQKELSPILPTLFKGCNATVFAYGATGSGKTYTMQGSENRPGLVPLALMNILSMAKESSSQVEVSYYEVYMDRCYDLLEPKALELLVLEDAEGNIQLRGLTQIQVRTIEEFKEVFANGCLHRKVGKTGLNDASSRSHGVLMVTITSGGNMESPSVVGKLNLIDLAGNEDNRRTGNEGIRLAESARINQSLFALSNVINALNTNEIRVPYRDSKLTRILQDSLGGQSRGLMIACLNPGSYQEAVHTLSLATRSRQIMNFVDQNERMDKSRKNVKMEEKLHEWLEAKSRTLPRLASSSPNTASKEKPFFTPSRLNLNHMRIQAKGTPNTISKARRVLMTSTSMAEEQNFPLAPACPPQESLSTTSPEKENMDVEYQNFGVQSGSITSEKALQPLIPPGTPLDKAMVMESTSPPLSLRLHRLGKAMREVLEPMPMNILSTTTNNDLSSFSEEKGQSNLLLPNLSAEVNRVKKLLQNAPSSATLLSSPLSPEKQCEKGSLSLATPVGLDTTPQSSHIQGAANKTPLEKFSVHSSGIKNSLVKEYLGFLNTASRDELLELKGIGEKRAAHILSLRESSEQFKELEDLEKIGLSVKQAQMIFKNTARQIFS